MTVLFVTGIDTDIGKTIATGMLAKALQQEDYKVITQKIVQTGCQGIAEDIVLHRDMMGIPLQPEDKDLTTCPYVFSKAASPHLASSLAKVEIETHNITLSTQQLMQKYEVVVLEGAGGLLVPITESCLTIDYIAAQGYPVVLVTSGRLGSINHTLLSIEAIRARCLPLHAVVYNHWQSYQNLNATDEPDLEIADSTKAYLQSYLNQYHPDTFWVDLPNLATDSASHDSISNYAKHIVNK